MILKYKKLSQNAKSLSKKDTDAGYDLASIEDITVPPNTLAKIKTGISVELPINTVGLIWPRSGMGINKVTDIYGGVIDESYRGEIVVGLYNSSGGILQISAGDRVAQLLVQPILNLPTEEFVELSETERGSSGFASSGW